MKEGLTVKEAQQAAKALEETLTAQVNRAVKAFMAQTGLRCPKVSFDVHEIQDASGRVINEYSAVTASVRIEL